MPFWAPRAGCWFPPRGSWPLQRVMGLCLQSHPLDHFAHARAIDVVGEPRMALATRHLVEVERRASHCIDEHQARVEHGAREEGAVRAVHDRGPARGALPMAALERE